MTQIVSQEKMLQDFQAFLEHPCNQRDSKLVYNMYYNRVTRKPTSSAKAGRGMNC